MYNINFHERIKSDMPKFVFELLAYKHKRSSSAKQTIKITIKSSESGTVIQEIIPSEFTVFGADPIFFADDLGFIIEDMNFDGSADIRIVEFLPAGPNVPYICWVWDEVKEQYVYDSALSSITSLRVDFENELIWTFGRACSSEHFELYYQYKDGILTLIKEVRTGYLDEDNPNQGYAITNELLDTKWVMTGKEKISIGGG